MLELRAFAVGRKGNLAAALSERLKHLPDAVKGFDPWQILGFVDLSLSLQDLPSLGLAKPRVKLVFSTFLAKRRFTNGCGWPNCPRLPKSKPPASG